MFLFGETRWRYAFILGNSKYDQFGELPNAARDARAIARKLEDLDFVVHLHTDLDSPTVEAAFELFVEELKAHERVESVVLYFAGHGYQEGSRNYLLPVAPDAEDFQQISLQRWISTVEKHSERRLIFLDACRTNFNGDAVRQALAKTRSVSGLSEISITNGLGEDNYESETFIAFSAAPGRPAYDEGRISRRLSPFANALSRYIDMVELPHSVIMGLVQGFVRQDTDDEQMPWTSSSLNQPYFFNPSSFLFVIGNVPAIVAAFCAFVVLLVALVEWQLRDLNGVPGGMDGAVAAASTFAVALSLLTFGVSRAYGRIRGNGRRETSAITRRMSDITSSGLDGLSGGIIGGIIGASLVAVPYWWDWRNTTTDNRVDAADCRNLHWLDPFAADVCPRLGLLLAECITAGAFVGAVLGGLAIGGANWAQTRRPAFFVRSENRRFLVGAISGGALAGLILGPIVTAYFGAQDRPFLEPRFVQPFAVLAVSVMGVSIANYSLDRFSRRRVLRSVFAAAIGTLVAFGALGVVLVALTSVGFSDAILDWAADGFSDATHSPVAKYGYLAAAGVPYGVIFGLFLGLLIGISRILSDPWRGRGWVRTRAALRARLRAIFTQ